MLEIFFPPLWGQEVSLNSVFLHTSLWISNNSIKIFQEKDILASPAYNNCFKNNHQEAKQT